MNWAYPVHPAAPTSPFRQPQPTTTSPPPVVMEDHLTAVERRDLRRQHRRAAASYPADWPVSPKLSR
jgi:hypothetical protein